MSLARTSVARPVGTVMVGLILVVLGLFFFDRLPVDLLPRIVYPRIFVSVSWPGVDPRVMEEEVTKPLERELATTDGIVTVFSTTTEGNSSIQLFFQLGRDIDLALRDASSKLDRARAALPDDVEPPFIGKSDPAQLPILEFAVTAPAGPGDAPLTGAPAGPSAPWGGVAGPALRVWADQVLVQQLLAVAGVGAVLVVGGQDEEVQVLVDLPRLQGVGVRLGDLLGALREANVEVSGGRVEGSRQERLSRLSGKFRSPADIETVLLRNDRGEQLYLRDVARVVDGGAEQRVFATLDGRPAIKVAILKQPDANTLAVIDGVKRRVEALRAGGAFPPGVELQPVYDQSFLIGSAVRNVRNAALTAAALASLVVFLFLGSLRRTFVMSLAITLAVCAAFVGMGLLGLSINIFSLGGLAIGVGLLVDNAIVMLENIDRRQRLARAAGGSAGGTGGADDPITVAGVAGREVEGALVASTTTNLVSVLPFLLVSGFASLLFGELILTISIAIAASLLVALTLVPMLGARLLTLRWTSGIGRSRAYRVIERGLGRLTDGYTRLLDHVLRHRLLYPALFALAFAASVPLVTRLGAEILPAIDEGRITVSLRFPTGTTLEANRAAVTRVDAAVRAHPAVASTFATAGGRIFSRAVREDTTRGGVDVRLRATGETRAVARELRQRIAALQLPGVRVQVAPARTRGISTANVTHNKDLSFTVQGPELEVLGVLARQVQERLAAVPGLVNVDLEIEEGRPEYRIVPDRERAERLGLSVQALGEVLETAVGGAVPTRLTRADRQVDVRVRLDRLNVRSQADLEALPLFVPGQGGLRLGQVARIESGIGPAAITRENQTRVVQVTGDVSGRSLGEVAAEARARLAGLALPPGYRVLPGGEAETLAETNRSLVVLGLLAAFLVYAVMAIQYDSVLNPLVIMLTVPMALVGTALALWATATPLSASVLIGVVLLVGIVVNNAIVLVETIEQRRAAGLDREAAVREAAPTRLRPILMTSLTSIVGLLPLAIGAGEGAEMLRPIGLVVIGGLALSTFLTLLIIPSLYLAFDDLGAWARRVAGAPPRRIAPRG